MPSDRPWCDFCPHETHPIGQKCGVKRPYVDEKPCTCCGKVRIWDALVSAIGNVLGSKF